jgi:hypothetical protein
VETVEAVIQFVSQVRRALDALERALGQLESDELDLNEHKYVRCQTLKAQDYLVRGLTDLCKAMEMPT